MTTIAASPGTLDPSAPPAPASLVRHALEAATPRPPEWSRWHLFSDDDRADAIGALAIAIRETLPLLSPAERREFAAELLGGAQ